MKTILKKSAGSRFFLRLAVLVCLASAIAALAAPVVQQSPMSCAAAVEGAATFRVTASGDGELAYQWYFNGGPVAGATGDTLILTAVVEEQAGSYSVTVSDSEGLVSSEAAELTVTAALAAEPVSTAATEPVSAEAAEPVVVVDGSTPGYYNNALGTILDGTAPQFPLPLGIGDDSTIVPSPEPNLAPAAGVLGDWLAFPSVLNANWQWQSTIPATWAVNAEDAIIYPLLVGPEGVADLRGDFDADNGLFVWVNGQYKFGAVAPGLPSPAGQYEYTNINLGSLAPGTNYIQVLREDSGVATGYQIRITGFGSSEPPVPVDPPVITQQPAGQTVIAGSSASFSVAADGTSLLAYQWSFNGTPISGATSKTLELTGVQTAQAGSYAVTVTNLGGVAVSSNALLSVIPINTLTLVDGGTSGYYNNALGTVLDGTAPEFPLPLGSGGDDPALNPTNAPNLSAAASVLGDWLAQPPALNANWQWQSPVPATWNVNEESAIVYPVVVGSNGLANVRGDFDADNGLFVWINGQYKFGGVAPGYSSPSGQYEYANVALGDLPPGTNYIQVLREDNGVGTGYAIRIYATTPASPEPQIVQQPAGTTVDVGATASFTVGATGAFPRTYQWRFEGSNIAGATRDSLSIGDVQFAQAGNYSVVVSNAFGFVVSSNAYLNVVAVPPSLVTQPQDRTVYQTRTVSFSVGVAGTPPFGYQWRKGTVPIANATGPTFTRANVQFADAGLYDVVVTNIVGSVTSRQALLTVNPLPPCAQVPAGAVAWWPGQSNTWDVLNGLDGAWSIATSTLYSTGKVSSALRFTAGQYLQVPTNALLDLGAGAGLTIEGWVRVDGGVAPVSEWNDGAGNVGAGLLINGTGGTGYIEATLTDTNRAVKKTATLRSSSIVMTNGIWQHVALWYDRASGRAGILVGGQPVVTTNIGDFRLATSANFYLGYRRSGAFSGSRMIGAIDELTLYNRPLTTAEIQAIIASDEVGKCAPPPLPCVTPPADIAAWWGGNSNALDAVSGSHARTNPANFSLSTYHNNTGIVSAAFAFRGQNYLSVPRSDSLDLGTGTGLTMEAWILPNQSRGMPILEWTDSNSFGANLWLSPTRGVTALEANLIDITGGFHLIQSPLNTITLNAWQHVALTYDKLSGQAVMYVNGNAVVTTNLGGFTPRTALPLMIGAHPPYTSSGPQLPGALPTSSVLFSGLMDEIALYRRALNPLEIRSLSKTRPVKCTDLPPTIGLQPQDAVVAVGGALTLNVVAGGSAPLAYQWFLGGKPIAGANAATWVRFAQSGDAGNYTVVVTNLFGSVTSRVANVSVLPLRQCVSAPWGAVAFWRGESNTLDELGALPAAWGSSTAALYTPPLPGGKVRTAFLFNGGNHLLVNSNAALNVAAGGGFTVEGWIKPDTYTGTMPVFEWNDGRGNIGVGLMFGRTGPGALEVTLTDIFGSSGGSVVFATTNYTLGSASLNAPPWTHVAVTYDAVAGRVMLFVNGRAVAERVMGLVYRSPSYGRFQPNTAANLYFGWRPSGVSAGARFRGAMDEMTLYYRALSPLELQAVYAAGANGKCAPQSTCLAITDSVAGWWRGQGDLTDSIFTNHGTAFSGGVGYTNGVSGLAMQFAAPSYVSVPASPELNVGSGPGMTFEAWIRPAYLGAMALAAWNSGNGTQGVSLGTSPTRGQDVFEVNFVDVAGVSRVLVSPFRAVTNGGWQHVATTYDPATGLGVLYVNGSPVTITNLGFFTPRTTGNLYLGYRPPGNYPGQGYRYYGLLDEVLVHRRALTGGEITASYRNAATRCAEPPVIVQQPQPSFLRVNAGSDVTLSVLAMGNPVLRYQWFQNGKPIYDRSQQPAAFTRLPTLVLTNVVGWNEGLHYCIVSNAFGSATSSNVMLFVNYPPVANASNTVNLLISPNGSNAVAVLDGTRSRDPDQDPLTYAWFLGSEPAPLATGVVAVVTLPVGVNPVTLTVSDGLLTRSNAVAIEVLTTAQALDRLVQLAGVEAANPQPLLATLRAALASIDRSQPQTAINQLEAFKNKVNGQVRPHDPALADQLIAEADAIIAALNGSTTPFPERIEIAGISLNESGRPNLKIHGKPGRTLVVETSTDGVNWEKVGVATDRGGGEFEFGETEAPAAQVRFYRVVSPK